jgi:hypothetical protein
MNTLIERNYLSADAPSAGPRLQEFRISRGLLPGGDAGYGYISTHAQAE